MKNNLIATEIHYSTLCYVVICYRDKKPSLFLLMLMVEVMGIFFFLFFLTNFNQSFIYHGWTLNLDKVFGWWSYIFYILQPNQCSYFCCTGMHYFCCKILELNVAIFIEFLFSRDQFIEWQALALHEKAMIATVSNGHEAYVFFIFNR